MLEVHGLGRAGLGLDAEERHGVQPEHAGLAADHVAGHVAYFGIGSYVCGILMKTYAVPFAIALPAAGRPFSAASTISGDPW